MSANRRHRRGRVWTTTGLWRRVHGRERAMRSALDRIYDAADRRYRTMRFSEDVAVAKRALAYGYFRNDSGRTIRAGEAVFLTATGGVAPVVGNVTYRPATRLDYTTTGGADPIMRWVCRNPDGTAEEMEFDGITTRRTVTPGTDNDR